MLTKDLLKDLLHKPGLTPSDKILLILAVNAGNSKSVSEIKELASSSGLRRAKNWNISQILSRAKTKEQAPKAIRTDKGWELTQEGKNHLNKLGILDQSKSAMKEIALDLRGQLRKIRNENTEKFLKEAISCFEYRLYRAAVVLSWVGALSMLYDYVANDYLVDFNKEAKRRSEKWRDAKNSDDLTRMKENDFLDILESLSIVGKSVKDELKGCLKFRNGCGHPNSLRIGENRVTAHIETLI